MAWGRSTETPAVLIQGFGMIMLCLSSLYIKGSKSPLAIPLLIEIRPMSPKIIWRQREGISADATSRGRRGSVHIDFS